MIDGLGILFFKNGYKAFEGEFLKGLRNGFGVEFDREGDKVSETVYSEGVKNVEVKEYYKNGVLKFKGKY